MSVTYVGLIGLGALFALLAIRMPVALAMMLVGIVGIGHINGQRPALSTLVEESFVISSSYELIVMPLVVLMGNFAALSGMSRDLYGAAYAWFGHWRGGLASATIAACAGFAAQSIHHGATRASLVNMMSPIAAGVKTAGRICQNPVSQIVRLSLQSEPRNL